MSINGALQIGRSALAASQAAIQVAGHNMANAGTVGFHRQSVHLAPSRGEILGRNAQVGSGVLIQAVRREIDVALQSRYRDALTRHHADLMDQRFLNAIETIQNELTGNDLSSILSSFFNSFSELANNPEDTAVRSVVVQQGRGLASRVASLRSDYMVVLREVDRSLDTAASQVNDLLDRIAIVNSQVVDTEGPGGQASALRDQRDVLIDELAEFIDVTVIEQSNGGVDILVGSVPVLLGGLSRGIELRTTSSGGQNNVSIRVKADGTQLQVESGTIGGLLRQREETVRPALDALDEFAHQLVFQVNRVHSQGQGRIGFTSVTGTYGARDAAANLNSSTADLPFTIANGSFFIHVTHAQTGVRSAHQINVNGNAMSLNDLVTQINTVVGVPNVTASVSTGGHLVLNADAGYQISFSDDSSGALAALGVNTFFSGTNASDIDVNALLVSDPSRLAAGAGHVAGSNGTAVALADLQSASLSDLGGKSLREYWQNEVNQLGVRTAAANAAVESSAIVRDSLGAQVQAVSGVSLDEESINLLQYQRQFQAAARFISIIDETLETLLSIV